MSNWAASSQRRNWLFDSAAAVDARRSSAHERSLSLARQCLAEAAAPRPAADATPDAGRAAAETITGAGPAPLGEPLTLAEESLLRAHYERKLLELVAAFRFPAKVQGAAVAYFKRFYLQHSAMDYEPLHVMLTCVYLACKCEECHVSAREFGRGAARDATAAGRYEAVVLRHEVPLMQALNFDLVVHSPHRALVGLTARLAALLPESATPVAAAAAAAAGDCLTRLLLTDAVLLHPPGCVALAALMHGLESTAAAAAAAARDSSPSPLTATLVESLGESLLESLAAEAAAAAGRDVTAAAAELRAAIAAVASLLPESASAAPPAEELRRVDLKLKACRNPATHPDSDHFRARAAVRAAEAARRSLLKQQRSRAKEEAENEAITGFPASAVVRIAGKPTPAKRGKTST